MCLNSSIRKRAHARAHAHMRAHTHVKYSKYRKSMVIENGWMDERVERQAAPDHVMNIHCVLGNSCGGYIPSDGSHRSLSICFEE